MIVGGIFFLVGGNRARVETMTIHWNRLCVRDTERRGGHPPTGEYMSFRAERDFLKLEAFKTEP